MKSLITTFVSLIDKCGENFIKSWCVGLSLYSLMGKKYFHFLKTPFGINTNQELVIKFKLKCSNSFSNSIHQMQKSILLTCHLLFQNIPQRGDTIIHTGHCISLYGFSWDIISSKFCKPSYLQPPCWFPLRTGRHWKTQHSVLLLFI